MVLLTILDMVFIAKAPIVRRRGEIIYLYIDGSLRIINFSVIMFMFVLFMNLYFYFIGLMEKKLSFQNEKMTKLNKAVCYWGLFLALVTLA
jgi:hypothetical protein